MKGVILQPGYIPWLGFFNQMAESDVFIFLDDVQYDRRGWRNRNRIKGNSGPIWLTIPVIQKGRYDQLLSLTAIDNSQNWQVKHLRAIHHWYKSSPFFDLYFPELESFFQRSWDLLVQFDISMIDLMMKWLDITTPTQLSSSIEIDNFDKTGRLVALCKRVGISEYISGPLCLDYMDYNQFKAENIRLFLHHYQHPEYRQKYPPFIPYLSCLDLVFNEGPDSSRILRDTTACVEFRDSEESGN